MRHGLFVQSTVLPLVLLAMVFITPDTLAVMRSDVYPHPLHVQAAGVAQVSYEHRWREAMDARANAAHEAREFHLASRLWAAMAEQGDSDAAFKLGLLYDAGQGVAHDAQRAAYWYRRAAESGHLHAQHNLAVAYANGEGVEMNIAQALRWWQIAAQRGNTDSQYNLGIVYAMGIHGIDKNFELAKRWWRKAAVNGDPMAQYNLGTLYVNADGQVRSYCEATRWWEESARKGVQQASWALQVIRARRDYKACW